MTSATLSSKFQLAIPKAIRDELQLKPGQKFVVITKGRGIELIPQPSMEWARGLLKGHEPGEYRSGAVLLLVAHTWRDEDGEETVRIISARKATARERQRYEQGD